MSPGRLLRGGRPGTRAPLPTSPSALLSVLLVALALIGLTAVPAAAHAAVVATTPAAGAALDTAPATVSVRFSEAVQAASDAIRVLDADGTRVDRGDAAAEPGHSDTVAVTLRPGLASGTYTVAWHVTSADSHPVHGAFAFAVGHTGGVLAPLADADRGASPAVTSLVHLARGIGYAGLALLVGAVGIGVLLDGATGRAAVGRQARAGGLTLTVSAAVSLLAQGPYAAETGLNSLFDPALLHNTLSGRTGVAEALRVVLAAGLTLAMGSGAQGAPDQPESPGAPEPHDPTSEGPLPPQPTAAAPHTDRWAGATPWARFTPYAPFPFLVALAATFSATSHAATGRHAPVAFTADLLHLLAMGLWLGGLVALATLCTNRTAADPGKPSAFTAALRRFSPLAAWCVAVLAVTGTLQAVRLLGSVGDLLTTGWGRYLIAKLTAVLVLLALARTARRWTHRHAARRPDPAGEPAPPPLRRMRRTLAAEAGVGVVVLALSTLLAGSAPPADRSAGTVGSASAPAAQAHLHTAYDTGGPGGSGSAVAVVTPRPDGSVAIDLTLTTAAGTPARPAELTAALSLPALNIGPLPLALKQSTPGHWKTSATPTPPGAWQLALTIRTSDVDETAVTFPATTLP